VADHGLRPCPREPQLGRVDLMNKDGRSPKFIKVLLEEFYKRYSQYFGNAMPATFATTKVPTETSFPGRRALFETFTRKAGYDLIPKPSGLTYDMRQDRKAPLRLADTTSELIPQLLKQVVTGARSTAFNIRATFGKSPLFWGPAWQGRFLSHRALHGHAGLRHPGGMGQGIGLAERGHPRLPPSRASTRFVRIRACWAAIPT